MKTETLGKKCRWLAIVLILIATEMSLAQTTEFTYQGKLSDSGTPSATYDFEFYLCDSANDCTNPLSSNSRNGVPVTNGIFTITLNFGSADFTGATDLFLEIRVKRPADSTYTALLPRQKLNSVPFAILSNETIIARDSFRLGGLAANQYVQTNDTRLSDARNPLPGSSNYVQNTNTAQSGVNFNIGGTGTANIFSATTQFNIGGERVLSVAGANNVFVGKQSGRDNASGNQNTFVGDFAGTLNVSGRENSFFGAGAGIDSTGNDNTYLGSGAGSVNRTGSGNIFIGRQAGNTDTGTPINNSIVIGNNVKINTSNTIVLGTTAQSTQIPGLLNVGGLVNVGGLLNVGGTANVTGLLTSGDLGGGNFNMRVVNTAAGGGVVAPNLYIRSFAQSASGFHLCWRAAGDGIAANVITNCISPLSSERYKQNSQPFTAGLDVIKRLKPVAFNWKADGTSDVGLNAEDVAAVAPNLVTRNEKGEVEEVKENSLNVLFINAIKEQQAQIERQENQIKTQQEQLKQQQQQIDALKKLVCASNPQAEICKEEQE